MKINKAIEEKKNKEALDISQRNNQCQQNSMKVKKLHVTYLPLELRLQLLLKPSIREETLSRWRQTYEFKEALELATKSILKEIVETHKNILISSQNIILDALSNNDLDLLKKLI